MNTNYLYYSNHSSDATSRANSINPLPILTIILMNLVASISFYVPIIFAPFGIIFNFLIIVIFINSSLGTVETTRLYYLVIAISELGSLVFKDSWYELLGIGWVYLLAQNPLGILNSSSYSSPEWLCPLNMYIAFVFEIIGNNTFVILELERIGALYFPLKTRTLFSFRKSLFWVALLCLLSLVISITAIPVVSIKTTGGIFTSCNSLTSKTTVWNDLSTVRHTIDFIFPPLAILICSLLIIIKIFNRHDRQVFSHGSRKTFSISNKDISVFIKRCFINR